MVLRSYLIVRSTYKRAGFDSRKREHDSLSTVGRRAERPAKRSVLMDFSMYSMYRWREKND